MSCLLVGETSQGRGSDEREEALIHPIAISKQWLLIVKHKVLRIMFSIFFTVYDKDSTIRNKDYIADWQTISSGCQRERLILYHFVSMLYAVAKWKNMGLRLSIKPCFLNNKISIILLLKAYFYFFIVGKRWSSSLVSLYHITH